MRVLFLSPRREEYLADSVFHGLRTLLGGDVVDYPKHEIMYKTCPEASIRRARGRGFTLYGLLDDIEMDRSRAVEEIYWREFDLVVFGAIHESFGAFVELYPELRNAGIPAVALDGADVSWIYPYGGRWWRESGWWMLPRAHRRLTYFKRELTPETYRDRCYRLLPAGLASMLPILRGVRPISYAIPAEKIVNGSVEKSQLFARHIVDGEVAAQVEGAMTAYPFSDESDYYADLRRSHYAITTKRAGWDCLRHYEIAANGTVPCFRDLTRKPKTCAPHGLSPANSISYSSYEDLRSRVARISAGEYASLREGALAWARSNSTAERAKRVLAAAEPALSAARSSRRVGAA